MDRYEQSLQLDRDAFTQSQAGKFDDAIKLYYASFDLSANPHSLRGIGECYMSTGQYREAVIYFAASAGLRPFPKASFQLAEALIQIGCLDEAKRAVERAIALMPHYEAAHELLAEINHRIAEGSQDSATQT